jgi:hypothetical protein
MLQGETGMQRTSQHQSAAWTDLRGKDTKPSGGRTAMRGRSHLGERRSQRKACAGERSHTERPRTRDGQRRRPLGHVVSAHRYRPSPRVKTKRPPRKPSFPRRKPSASARAPVAAPRCSPCDSRDCAEHADAYYARN